MLYGKYQFFCRLIDETILPYYKGSTFRGVFGRALKRVVCALKMQECDQCLLKQRCVYALVFETPVSVESSDDPRIVSPPHPFVIEPALTTDTQFAEGSSFDFHLLLFGEANHNLPYFIYAFEQMGHIGIGRKLNGKRGRFALEEVKAADRIIFSGADQKIILENAFQDVHLKESEGSHDGDFQLTVRILTPLRLKFENRFKADLPFHVLIRAMLRRVSSLFNCYGKGEPDLDYRGMVRRAEEVHIAKDKLRWYDWKRYSFRQDKAMLMGGMVGSVTYAGKLGEFMPLIDLCSKVHVGKQTSFGLGQIHAERAP